MEYILQTNNLSKSYGSNNYALLPTTISIPSGKFVGLLGPNGSGKTTFIKMLAGILTKSTGDILIGGHEIGADSKALVAYLPDRTYLDTRQSISFYLDFFTDFYDDFDENLAQRLLVDLGITADVELKTLSKGTLEKVQLILVMSRRAKLYLLDEPIAGVDPAAREYIVNTIRNNLPDDATVLMSTHLIQDIEGILDEAIFLRTGEVMLYDSADNIRLTYGKTIDEVFREVFRC